MSFDLLSEPIRKYIRNKRWEQLRPIQTAAIERILKTDSNYILASRTASGKTEAAFLPILSSVNFNEEGVQVLYISPLIALINDQFFRIEELCKDLEISVTKWHGEASRSLKNKLLKSPNGIVLITPESLEAMFVNKPYDVKHLFSNTKFVVIDEIHSFIGSDRGIQLKSILHRLQCINKAKFRLIGLSATIGDYDEAKKFTGDTENTKVLLDRTAKEINAEFRFFKADTEELPLELLKDLYLETKDNKVLIFPNSRGRAEEIAVKLKKISERVNGHPNYFSHHSSVNKEVREYVEYFAKSSLRQNFCISCTSTLELGIDIGTIDEVVQIDATHSIASLIQRIGRSGRREGENSNLFLYATSAWSLLQSLACWTLYEEGFIEPPDVSNKPFDILVHQALSIIKGSSGIPVTSLIEQLKGNFAFSNIEIHEIAEIIEHLINIDFIETLQGEAIIGVEGEYIVNSREFYSVFQAEENYKVINAGNTIGEIPLTTQIQEDENILLAARIWKIVHIDDQAKKIEVVSAKDGKRPKFNGGGGTIHYRIRERMLEILYSDIQYDLLTPAGKEQLNETRKEFSSFKIKDIRNERPVLTKEKEVELYTFSGSKINRALTLLLNIYDIKSSLFEETSIINVETTFDELKSKWQTLTKPLSQIDNHLADLIQTNPVIIKFSKWGKYLPLEYQVSLMKDRFYDFDGAVNFISNIKLIPNETN